MSRRIACEQCSIRIRRIAEIQTNAGGQDKELRSSIGLIGSQPVASQIGDLVVIKRYRVNAGWIHSVESGVSSNTPVVVLKPRL